MKNSFGKFSLIILALLTTISVRSRCQSSGLQGKQNSERTSQKQMSVSLLPAVSMLVRDKINFNSDWKFQLGDIEDAAQSDFNDSGWQSIGLPHSFSIPYFMSPDFYVGYGWYRKYVTLPKGMKHKKIFLEFEAVFQHAEIFVNNKKVGEHKGGYTGFSVDISEAVIEGNNVVAVRVNNLWNPGLAPRAGEHVFSGGIYRDVYMVITNPVHVDWCGTFIQTPEVSEKQASIKIRTEIRNEEIRSRTIQIKTEILDPDGKIVSNISSNVTLNAKSKGTTEQITKPILKPRRWDIDHPFLYTAVTTLLVDKKVVDKYQTVFGIRTLTWTADKGFFLNGKHLYLRGANVHQDHAGWGDAVTNAGFFRDVKMIKDAGFNFIRGAHYPHDPSFAEACDRLGVLFWSENPFWGIGGSSSTPEGYWNSSAYPTQEKDRKSFETSIKQQLQEMILINRNHPSIFVWSMSNEPFFTDPQTIGHTRNLLKELVNISHLLDPSRHAAIGGSQRPLDSNRIDKIGDVAGYNGDGGTIAIFKNPGIPSVVSEYGSTTAERPGNYEPGWGDLAADSGKVLYPWRSGQAIWCAFDHGSIAGSKLGKMGIIDYFRIPKRAWYWYRNEYSHIPHPEWPQSGAPAKLKLVADRLESSCDGTEDIKLNVIVLDKNGKQISNSPPVELKIVTGPGEFPTGSSIKFEETSDIRILDGEASIEIRSWYSGSTIIRATSPGIQSDEIQLEFTGGVPFKEKAVVTERPYVRFQKKQQMAVQQKFGRDNPTFSSTSQSGHLAGHAADGNPKTWWQPIAGDTAAKWVLDTEKRLAVSKIKIVFPEAKVYQYKIEIMEGNDNWKLVADFMNNTKPESEMKLDTSNLTGRMIRISFKNTTSAGLAEVEITGQVLE